jgi:hypothetical protein
MIYKEDGLPSGNFEPRSFVRFTPEIADKICAGLADGRKLEAICAEKGMPSCRTVFRWLAADADFLARYEQSREHRVGMAYSRQLGIAICDQLAEGRSLLSICSDAAMPGRTTVYNWLGQHAEFRELYDRAREWQAMALLDEVLDIADDSRNDWMRRHAEKEAGWVANGENIRRSELRVDTRKWAVARLSPKGDGAKRAGSIDAPVVKVVREIVQPRQKDVGG